MHTFNTLRELDSYIPNCIICRKSMGLTIDGLLSSLSAAKPRWSSGNERMQVKLHLKDGIWSGKHKSQAVVIDIVTNKVLQGEELVNRLMPQSTHVRKLCPTCHFKIHTVYSNSITSLTQGLNNKKDSLFPPLTIHSEELHYTMKGGKDVRITKYYNLNGVLSGEAATIRLDNKFLPPVPLDFDKMRDLAHLNKRLATIKLFH